VNAILRGVRVIDPLARLDTSGQDVWIDGGKILAIYHHIDADGVPVVDLTPTEGEEPCVLCPGFIDLHAHLRQPGDDEAETLLARRLAPPPSPPRSTRRGGRNQALRGSAC